MTPCVLSGDYGAVGEGHVKKYFTLPVFRLFHASLRSQYNSINKNFFYMNLICS